MLYIPCPYCGKRDEVEFICGGEDIARPQDLDNLTDAEWADYLFSRRNIRGEHKELWYHSSGCRKWFSLVRDTVTYKIISKQVAREKDEADK